MWTNSFVWKPVFVALSFTSGEKVFVALVLSFHNRPDSLPVSSGGFRMTFFPVCTLCAGHSQGGNQWFYPS